MSLFGVSMRGLRDGALLGILVYSLAYAAYKLRDPLQPHIADATVMEMMNQVHGMVATLGMAGAGYFALGGAAVGALPWGSLFGADERKRKRA
jgi:hypothetical protein